MIRLVRVEVLRLFSRRLVKIVAALTLLLVAAIVGIDAYNSAKPDSGDAAALQQRRSEAYDRDLAELRRDPDRPPEFEPPPKEEFLADPGQCFGPNTCDVSQKQPYDVKRKLPDAGVWVAFICAVVAFLVGASAAGAEWAAGTMQSLLYWESRRVRVVVAKIVGLFVVVAALVVAAHALFVVAAIPAGELRGSTDGLTSGVWTSHLLMVLRGVGVATFAGVLGFAIAFGTRVTAAALGIGFIYFAVLANLLIVWKSWLIAYMIGPVLGAWLEYGSDFSTEDKQIFVSGRRAGLTLVIYALVMVTAATVWFRQRDVT